MADEIDPGEDQATLRARLDHMRARCERLEEECELYRRRALSAEWRSASLAADLLGPGGLAEASPATSGSSSPESLSLRAELDAVYASTSWRITAPLRRLVARLRRRG